VTVTVTVSLALLVSPREAVFSQLPSTVIISIVDHPSGSPSLYVIVTVTGTVTVAVAVAYDCNYDRM
jgi:hypothetical protein